MCGLKSVKTKATPRKPPKKVSEGAQTALAGWGQGKDGNESFPRVPS